MLYTPTTWSNRFNGDISRFVAFILQASQAHGITIDGSGKYNVPSGNVTMDETGNDPPSPSTLTSYATTAIIGADDFTDDDTTVADLFDIIVGVTRQVTPTCTFADDLAPNIFANLPRTKSEPSGISGTSGRGHFPTLVSHEHLHSYGSPRWPVRSVERLPPFTPPEQLKYPVLVIGNLVCA